jgi:4-hydroxy-tetrahydrodipicolinate reductase
VTSIPILLYGASGRMGQAVRGVAAEFPDARLAACVARSTASGGCPEGCAWMTPDQLLSGGGESVPREAVVIDVSLKAGTARLLEWLERSPRALVSATTGLDRAEEDRIVALARRAPVLRATNLSLGNAVACAMLRAAGRAARDLFEIDLVEHHHAAKRDAPSGTALLWASLLAPGEHGKVRIHSIRSGTAVGTHRALLAGTGETLEIVHTVSDRSVFARGAIRAARFLAGRSPGLYTLEHMLETS